MAARRADMRSTARGRVSVLLESSMWFCMVVGAWRPVHHVAQAIQLYDYRLDGYSPTGHNAPAQGRCLPQHGVRGLLRAYPMSVLAMHLSGQFTFRTSAGRVRSMPRARRTWDERVVGRPWFPFPEMGCCQASAHRRRSFPDAEAFDLGRPRASLSRPTWCEPAIVGFHEDLPPVLVREGEGDPCFCGRSMVHHIEQQFPRTETAALPGLREASALRCLPARSS